MADTDKDSKTEKASSKRLNEALQKGNFAQAQEIGVVFTLFAGLLVVLWYGQDLAMNVMNLSVSIFGNLATIDINEDRENRGPMEKLAFSVSVWVWTRE